MNDFKIFNIITLVSSTLFAISSAEGKNWAVILVGWSKYRLSYAFEAAACRTYQTLRKGGIEKENIVFFSPNNAAFDPSNPVPGVIVHGYNGSDFSAADAINVYDDVEVDYTKGFESKDFFDVIKGNSSNPNLKEIGSGKVVKSGPKDNIFIYMHTIGGIGYCHLTNDFLLFTDKFIQFIEELSAQKAFNKMFIHFDSMSAGAMFDDYLDTKKRIIAYAMGGRYNDIEMCHYNPTIQAYTSTCEAHRHLTYLEKAMKQNGAKETIFDLFSESGLTSTTENIVHNLYGQVQMGMIPLKMFMAPKLFNAKTKGDNVESKKSSPIQRPTNKKSLKQALFDDEHISKFERYKIDENIEKIISNSIENMKIHEKDINDAVAHIPTDNFDCLRDVVSAVRSKCFTTKSRFLFVQYSDKFAKLCTLDVPKGKILEAVSKTC